MHLRIPFAVAAALALAPAPPPAGAAAAPAAPVTVYYLHGTVRCVTCIALEQVTVWTVRDSFGGLMDEGLLAVETVDYGRPENAHFREDFALEAPGIVLAACAGDTLRAWRRLDRAWELSALQAELEQYIVEQVRTFVRENLGDGYAPR